MKTVYLYRVTEDNAYSSISKMKVSKEYAEILRSRTVDEYFNTLGEAKTYLIEQLKYMRSQYSHAINSIRNITIADIQEADTFKEENQSLLIELDKQT